MMFKKYRDLFLDNALLTPLKKVIDLAKEHGVEVGDQHDDRKGYKVGQEGKEEVQQGALDFILMNCSMTISFVKTYSTHAVYITLLTYLNGC